MLGSKSLFGFVYSSIADKWYIWNPGCKKSSQLLWEMTLMS